MKKVFSGLGLLTVLLIFLSIFLYAKIAKAEDAVPDPFVPCLEDATGNPEFNSQRPYQASPCGDPPKAYFCKNDYIIEETVQRRYRPGVCDVMTGKYICQTDQNFDKNYEIQMSNVEFPIIGNTEDTKNTSNSTDDIDDAQKVNEYLAWYLSGTNQKAEYGTDTNEKIINFSGPTKKILPSVIQELQRFKVLHDAGTKTEFTDSEEFGTKSSNSTTNLNNPDIDPGKEGIQVEETESHNQVVVCTTKNKILGLNIPWLGIERPVPCTKNADTKYRMIEWWEGKQTGYLDSFNVIKGWDGSQRWSSTIPPFPWQFEKDVYYQKAYNEWRGRECLLILGRLACADLKITGVYDLHTNVWADLYQYIPLGNTVDRNAGHQIGDEGSIIKPLGQTKAEKQEGEEIIQTPVLFYPHTSSTTDILEVLNKSHTPKGMQTKKKDANEDIASPDIDPKTCDVVDVRSNSGDALTFDNGVVKDKQRIALNHVKFHVTQIECGNEVSNWFNKCEDGIDPNDPECDQFPMCRGTVQVIIPTSPKIPLATQLWNDTVAAQNTAFRKIFPKVEDGAPVSCIANIPAVSDVDYAVASEDTEFTGVDTPAGKVSPDEAQLFFPHLGSVYEYFLKGIQTALRPQGYGEPIPNGKSCVSTEAGNCSFSIQAANAAINATASKYGIPVAILKAIFEVEAGPYIADPSSYKCEERPDSGAAGIAQIKKSTYNIVTCESERLEDDIAMCTDPTSGKLSRCSMEGAIELMARILLFGAGKWRYGPNTCEAAGGLSLSNKVEWYNAVCSYGTGFDPNPTTVKYQNSIPASERPQGRDMNYCDMICHKIGQCPSYPVN